MPANVHYWKTIKAESVCLAIGGAETGVRNTVATIAAPLLPCSVIRLPVVSAIPLPGDLALMYLSGTALLCRPVVVLLLLPPGLLLRLLALLILLPFDSLRLSCGIVLLLP